ncbi:hypothetical protein LX32DRAFT_298434 [Colletotrichum zoysiae]|uniref:Uncharacterized protein n=1 Tax=Colletotrichum zoysiae TaxID=1216348 RepID=A0AAD9H3K3_9PEZI|nr:hypothetical protein LX32DRAFT_298434 [Colletotrichum zoysiae]
MAMIGRACELMASPGSEFSVWPSSSPIHPTHVSHPSWLARTRQGCQGGFGTGTGTGGANTPIQSAQKHLDRHLFQTGSFLEFAGAYSRTVPGCVSEVPSRFLAPGTPSLLQDWPQDPKVQGTHGSNAATRTGTRALSVGSHGLAAGSRGGPREGEGGTLVTNKARASRFSASAGCEDVLAQDEKSNTDVSPWRRLLGFLAAGACWTSSLDGLLAAGCAWYLTLTTNSAWRTLTGRTEPSRGTGFEAEANNDKSARRLLIRSGTGGGHYRP